MGHTGLRDSREPSRDRSRSAGAQREYVCPKCGSTFALAWRGCRSAYVAESTALFENENDHPLGDTADYGWIVSPDRESKIDRTLWEKILRPSAHNWL